MGNLSDRKFSSLVENNKTSAESSINTVYGQVVGGLYTSAAPTLANNDYGFLRLDSEGKLLTTANISGDVNVDSTSVSTSGIIGKASGTNADFITAYASGTTLTCTTLPSGVSSIEADDVVSIVQVSTAGAVLNTYSRDDVTIASSGTDPTTLTVTGATFGASDSFIVYTNIPQARGDKVDLIEVAGTATNVNGGIKDAGTQTITLATDDPAVVDLAAIELINTDIETATQAIQVSTEIMDDWDATEDSAIGTDGAVEMLEAKSAQKTAVADGDAVIPVTSLNGEQVIASYTWATNSNRNEEIDPVDEHYVEEELVDTTDLSADTYYYPSSTGKALGNFNNVSIHGVTTGGVTVTVEAKIDDSTDWVDITPAGYRLDDNTTGNASFVDQTFILDFDELHVRNIRIKSITADATNGVQYHWKLSAL